MSTIDQQIEARINAFVTELSALVREAALDSVRDALGGGRALRRGPGHPAVAVGAKAGAPKRVPSAKNIGGKRTPEQIEATVRSIHDYVKAHPSVPSEKIRNDLKLPRTAVRDGLDRLMAAKKLTMKGTRRAAKYTAR